MYCIACPPVLQLFNTPAEVFGEWAIDRLELPARGHDRNESGYPVDGCSKLSFARPQRHLGPLALGQIEDER